MLQKDTRDRTGYYKDNKESILSRSRKHYLEHRDRIAAAQRKKYSDPDNYIKYVYWRTMRRARDKGLDFNIEISDITIPEHCPILGYKLNAHTGNGNKDTRHMVSIDRIDPSKGYVKGNVQIISQQANVMKNSATKDELVMFAKYVMEKYGI